MYFKVWGCRGSIPAPATLDFDTRRYGGHTTCFEIQTTYGGSTELSIVDMGTGIRPLGIDLLRRLKSGRIPQVHARVFMTHIHLDHTFGMGFFTPLFITGQRIEFYALQMPSAFRDLNNQLASLIDGIQFPRHLDQLPSIGSDDNQHKAIHDVKFWDVLEFSTFNLHVYELNHPSGCAGWRFQERSPDGAYSGAVLGIGTDTEHFAELNPSVQRLGENADLLVLDGQYSEAEYAGTPPERTNSKLGWGHGTPRSCIQEAAGCGAKRLGITHHDPDHDDRTLDKMESQARRYNRRLSKPIPEVFFLREGMSLNL